MIKALLIPLFSFSALKLSLTLAITHGSLGVFSVSIFLLLIAFNIYVLVQLIRGESIFGNAFRRRLRVNNEENETS